MYHPNIDQEGNVCLNILREDWKPVLTINTIVYGLHYLFLVSALNFENFGFFPLIFLCFSFQDPNPEDPLNKDAAEVLQTNRRLFEHNVAKSLFSNK